MQRRVHLFVSGLVQGVFFRATTTKQAVSLGLTGWVRNLRDGRVEILAEGSTERISEFLAWCKIGPARARVEHLQVQDEKPLGDFVEFQVWRDS
jgi:acylphosphatase